MNITLKERLDLQRTARIITESQYNKLLKENEEMTPETIVQEIPKLVSKLENSTEVQKVANDIANDPKAMAALKNLLTKNGINPLSLNESTEDIAKKLAMNFMEKAKDAPESLSELNGDDSRDVTAEVTLGMAGFFAGGTLAIHLARLADLSKPWLMQMSGGSHMTEALIGAFIGAAVTVIAVIAVRIATDKSGYYRRRQ